MVQRLYKNWLLLSKITWRIWTASDKQWKVQKVEIWWASFIQKLQYISSAKILYTEDLTLLSSTCVKIHQITYFIFETISYFSQHNSSVFFSSNIIYFLQKKPIKGKIFRLSAARVKVHLIPHVIFQTKSKFFFEVWIFFQCHVCGILLYSFAETLCAIHKSSTLKCKFSDLPLLALKFTKFFMSFLEPRVKFLRTLHHSSMSWDITLLYFFIWIFNLYMLWTKRDHHSAYFQTFDCSHEN